MSNLDACLADANRSLTKAAPTFPSFAKVEYEDALLELAKRERRDGETEPAALARLLQKRDPRALALSTAAYNAESRELAKAAAL